MPTHHPVHPTCYCAPCIEARGREWVGTTLRKAREDAASGAMKSIEDGIHAFIADPKQPEASWTITNEASAPVAVLHLQRPGSAAPVAKNDPLDTIHGVNGAGGIPKPDWVNTLGQQIRDLQKQIGAAPQDLHGALQLIETMHKDLMRRAQEEASAKGGAPASAQPGLSGGQPSAPMTKAEKAIERRTWHAEVGRSARGAEASDQLRPSSELAFADLGKAARHDEARPGLLSAAAKRLKLDDENNLRSASELRLAKGAASEAHEDRRADMLFSLEQQLA